MDDHPLNSPRSVHPLDRPNAPQPAGQRPPPGLVLRVQVRVPYITYGLIALNVIIFIIRASSAQLELQTLLLGANSADAVFRGSEYWRFLTSMFLHAGIHTGRAGIDPSASLHLIFNMFALYYSGSVVERLNGHIRFLAIYLLGGLSGALLSAVMGTDLAVGASGAVFGLFAAQLDFYLRHRAVFGDYGRAQIRSLTTLVLINLAMGLLVPNIDNWAHIGGAIGGYLASRLGGARYEAQASGPTPVRVLQNATALRTSLSALGGLALLLAAVTVAAALALR